MNEFPPRTPDLSPEKEREKRKRERIAIGILAALVVGLTILEARLGAIGGTVAFTSNIIIFALINSYNFV